MTDERTKRTGRKTVLAKQIIVNEQVVVRRPNPYLEASEEKRSAHERTLETLAIQRERREQAAPSD